MGIQVLKMFMFTFKARFIVDVGKPLPREDRLFALFFYSLQPSIQLYRNG